MFMHSDKDKITIGAFTATLDNFLLLEPSYHLPRGAIWQLYVPGNKHLVGYGLFQRDEGPVWADGDAYLANETAYATMQPDTSPDVAGFEAALVAAFGGDFVAINNLYSGWPLFRDMLEGAQWSVADLLLSTAYANGEISTATYTAIVSLAQQFYIPMALQGRPGIMPLNLLDTASVVILLPGGNQADSLAVGLSEGDGQVIVPIPVTPDAAAVQVSEVAQVESPVLVGANDDVTGDTTESTPTLVMT